MEQYVSSDPTKINPAILVPLLKDGTRKRVISALGAAGSEGSSFKELTTSTGLRPTTLAYHLKVLCHLELAKRGLRVREGRRDYSVYSLSHEGSNALSMVSILTEKGSGMEQTRALPSEMPSVTVTYMTIGPRFLLINGWRRR